MRRGTIPFALPPFQGWVRRIVVACAAIFLLQTILARYGYEETFQAYAGLVPGLVIHGRIWQIVSYSFLHESPSHLLFNMLTLWMVGSLEEMEWGSRRFLEVYFVSVIGGALTTVTAAYLHIFGADPHTPTIGASAGVLGILMALAVLDGDRVFTLMLVIAMKVKYLVAITVFLVVVATLRPTDNTANVAHAGGLLFGFLWAKFIPRRGLGLEASEAYYGVQDAWHRWKRRQAAKKFEVYMRKSEREVPRFDDKGNYILPEDPPRKPNGNSGSKWVN